jgi:hypothetical protein
MPLAAWRFEMAFRLICDSCGFFEVAGKLQRQDIGCWVALRRKTTLCARLKTISTAVCYGVAEYIDTAP